METDAQALQKTITAIWENFRETVKDSYAFNTANTQQKNQTIITGDLALLDIILICEGLKCYAKFNLPIDFKFVSATMLRKEHVEEISATIKQHEIVCQNCAEFNSELAQVNSHLRIGLFHSHNNYCKRHLSKLANDLM